MTDIKDMRLSDRLRVYAASGLGASLTPDQCRQLAAAIESAEDTRDILAGAIDSLERQRRSIWADIRVICGLALMSAVFAAADIAFGV